MAFTVVNGVAPFPRINRGQPLSAGTIAAANNAVAFSLPSPREFVLNKIVITIVGGSAITAVLEGSIDGGATWFNVPAQASDLVVGTVDTAVAFVGRYDVSGLDACCLFRFGATAITGSGVVWIAMA